MHAVALLTIWSILLSAAQALPTTAILAPLVCASGSVPLSFFRRTAPSLAILLARATCEGEVAIADQSIWSQPPPPVQVVLSRRPT